MRPMKEAGLKEIKSARSRARKLWGMERISRADFQYIDTALDMVEARIISMVELDEFGKEVHD